MRGIVTFVLAGVLLLSACRTNMNPAEAGNARAARRVLIAGERTTFKDELVAGVIRRLGTRDWYFRIVGLDQVEEQDPARYGAILLVAAYRAGRIDGRVSRYLQKDPTNGKIVVFYTRGTEDPMPERARPDIRVDALTSASRDDRLELRAGQVAALLAERF